MSAISMTNPLKEELLQLRKSDPIAYGHLAAKCQNASHVIRDNPPFPRVTQTLQPYLDESGRVREVVQIVLQGLLLRSNL